MKIDHDFLLEAFVKAFNCEFVTLDKIDQEIEIFKSQLKQWEAEYDTLRNTNNAEISDFSPTNMYDYLFEKIGREINNGFMNNYDKIDLINYYLRDNSGVETEESKLFNATLKEYSSEILKGNPNFGTWQHKPIADFIESRIIHAVSQTQVELLINPPLTKIVLKNIKEFKNIYSRSNSIQLLDNELKRELKNWANYCCIADLFHYSYYYLSRNEIGTEDKVILNFGLNPSTMKTVEPIYGGYLFINSGGGKFLQKDNSWPSYEISFSVFIIGQELIKNIIVVTSGLNSWEGGVHVIKRDIKNINIIEHNVLQISYHGIHSASNIVMDSYEDALSLQERLLEIQAGWIK
jgi:hypothetical protein